MLAILSPNDCDTWISTETALEGLRSLLEPYPARAMKAYPVSKAVGKVKNDGPELIESVSLGGGSGV